MGINFIKKGAAAQQLAVYDKQKHEERKADLNKAFRFFLKQGEAHARKILFVDGDIDPNTNCLDAARVYEHTVNVNGKWDNFVCLKETDPGAGHTCNFCSTGDRPDLVNFLTAIDLTPYTSKDGKKTYPFTRKLFVFKHNVYEILNTFAKELGTLSGQVFKVQRAGDKSERVGDVFIPLQKVTDVAKAKQQFTQTIKFKDAAGKETSKVVCLYEALDYNAELKFKTAEDLAKMGVGAPNAGAFSTQATAANEPTPPADSNEFLQQM
jgi:hypothetical protein